MPLAHTIATGVEDAKGLATDFDDHYYVAHETGVIDFDSEGRKHGESSLSGPFKDIRWESGACHLLFGAHYHRIVPGEDSWCISGKNDHLILANNNLVVRHRRAFWGHKLRIEDKRGRFFFGKRLFKLHADCPQWTSLKECRQNGSGPRFGLCDGSSTAYLLERHQVTKHQFPNRVFCLIYGEGLIAYGCSGRFLHSFNEDGVERFSAPLWFAIRGMQATEQGVLAYDHYNWALLDANGRYLGFGRTDEPVLSYQLSDTSRAMATLTAAGNINVFILKDASESSYHDVLELLSDDQDARQTPLRKAARHLNELGARLRAREADLDDGCQALKEEQQELSDARMQLDLRGHILKAGESALQEREEFNETRECILAERRDTLRQKLRLLNRRPDMLAAKLARIHMRTEPNLAEAQRLAEQAQSKAAEATKAQSLLESSRAELTARIDEHVSLSVEYEGCQAELLVRKERIRALKVQAKDGQAELKALEKQKAQLARKIEQLNSQIQTRTHDIGEARDVLATSASLKLERDKTLALLQKKADAYQQSLKQLAEAQAAVNQIGKEREAAEEQRQATKEALQALRSKRDQTEKHTKQLQASIPAAEDSLQQQKKEALALEQGIGELRSRVDEQTALNAQLNNDKGALAEKVRGLVAKHTALQKKGIALAEKEKQLNREHDALSAEVEKLQDRVAVGATKAAELEQRKESLKEKERQIQQVEAGLAVVLKKEKAASPIAKKAKQLYDLVAEYRQRRS